MSAANRPRNVILLLGGAALLGCADEAPVELCFEPTVSGALCDPATTTFTLASTNPYYPLVPGATVVLEGFDPEENVAERVERTTLERTHQVDGVETHVLEHRQYIDGQIYEVAYNYYVEATDGTVCYFGEDVEFYENGALVDTHGSWLAGVGGARPGVIMPAAPQPGDRYLQEDARGQKALDQGRVERFVEFDTFAGETFSDVLVVQDLNPFDGCDEEEEKRYVAGIGEVQDVYLRMTEHAAPRIAPE